MGRVFMPPVDNPFEAVAAAVDRLARECRVIVVDMHAEATSEKIAMGWHLDGRVAAVVGTHTTCRPRTPASSRRHRYITDVGMTGPHDSIIGMARATSSRNSSRAFRAHGAAEENPRLQAVVVDADERTGLARDIVRLDCRSRHHRRAPRR